jgi:hypothetical protein
MSRLEASFFVIYKNILLLLFVIYYQLLIVINNRLRNTVSDDLEKSLSLPFYTSRCVVVVVRYRRRSFLYKIRYNIDKKGIHSIGTNTCLRKHRKKGIHIRGNGEQMHAL